jgi:hypothetical protein
LAGQFNRSGHGAAERPFLFKDICVDNLDILSFSQLFFSDCAEHPVKLNGDDFARLLGQSLGQRACATADLEHNVAGLNLRSLYQQPHQIQVDQKVLAQPSIRERPRFGEQLLDLLFRLHKVVQTRGDP